MAEHADDREGRARYPREHGALDETAGRGDDQELRRAQQNDIVAGKPAGAERARHRLAQGLRQDERHQAQQYHAVSSRQEECRAPAERLDQLAAQDRHNDGGDAEPGHDRAEHASGAGRVVEIAHHGAPQDRPGAGGDALEDAPGGQMADRGRERAIKARQRVEPEAGDQQLAAAIAVAERAEQELHDRERDRVKAERELDLADRSAEIAGNFRHGRKLQVDPEHRRDNRQDDHRADGARSDVPHVPSRSAPRHNPGGTCRGAVLAAGSAQAQ